MTQQAESKRSTELAAQVVARNPRLASCSDAVVHMFYHRSLFAKVLKEVEEYQKLRADRGKPRHEGEDKRLELAREIHTKQAYLDLLGFGLSEKQAKTISGFVCSSESRFAEAVEETEKIIAKRSGQ